MSDRRGYEFNASADVQARVEQIATRLETIIDNHEIDVDQAMQDIQVDGADTEYTAKEQLWAKGAREARAIVQIVRKTLEENDDIAQQSLTRARTAVDNI